jgi:UDP-3-O-[3-hydroxymyristoyl] N-acetylglucosamine deacetylase
VTIDFPHPAIGKEKIDLDVNEVSFSREIAPARTFGFLQDLQELQKRGLALGGSLDNAIGLDETKILNPEGLRFADEFVRHKALDALGDLVTLTMPLMGHLVLYKAGHDVMNKLVRKILDTPSCFKLIELGADLPPEIRVRSGL